MKQWEAPQIIGGAQRAIFLEQRGGAHRQYPLVQQLFCLDVGPAATTVANGQLEVLAHEVHDIAGGVQVQVDVRVLRPKAWQTRQQPLLHIGSQC